MAFPKGVSGNLHGSNSAAGRKMLRKVRTALNKGINGLGDAEANGTTAMGALITKALKKDVVGTLKALSSYMPKDLDINVQHTNAARSLTDDELADIIATRARMKHIESNTIDGDCKIISTESTGCVVKEGKKGGV